MLSGTGKDDVVLRTFAPDDDPAEVNALLLLAYKPLADAGMRYVASHEDVEATKNKIHESECVLAIQNGKIVACAMLRPAQNTSWADQAPEFYHQPGVIMFGRFAVLPSLQKAGLGSRIMDWLEARARELGFSEIALDTSERASHLIRMYEKRGYRFVQHHQWPTTNYRSVVMSKTLTANRT